MFTEHDPPERVQLLPGVNETDPVGVLPDIVSTTVALHVSLTPTMPPPGQMTVVEVGNRGIGETSMVVDEVAVCWGDPLSVTVRTIMYVPADKYVCVTELPVPFEPSPNDQMKEYGGAPSLADAVKFACSPV